VIPLLRLHAQRIQGARPATAAALVDWLGAVQAQDYAGTKWAIGLRLGKNTTDAGVEKALDDGKILRTHALRWTWQLVTPRDIRWLVELGRARMLARAKSRLDELGIDARTMRRSETVFERALRGENHLTRDELGSCLKAARIQANGTRLAHLLACAEMNAVVCSGRRRGKQHTYALLDERAPSAKSLSRARAIAELARRYFSSRGPATVADFVWWSGLSPADARAGLRAIRSQLDSADERLFHGKGRVPKPVATSVLLPAFDEYLVAYKNRDAVLDPKHTRRLNAGGGMLAPCVVVDGMVVGTWRRELSRGTVAVELDLLERPSVRTTRALRLAVARYAAFLELEPQLSL
jgi:hypothetical protein